MLEIDLYKNMNTASKTYGQYYGRAASKGVMTLDDLAQHMSEHNTPFSKGTIKGILTDMVSCIRELALEGLTIKIPDLALFKCSIQSAGATSLLDYDCRVHVKAVKLLAQSTGGFSRAELTKDASLRLSKLAMKQREEAEAAAGGDGTTEP
jgi:nucleoid DNA-binding protein